MNRGFSFARPAAQPPRNAGVLPKARELGDLVVSFIGDTPLDGPHVYADSGKRYDWSGLAGLNVAVVVKPGIDLAGAVRAIFGVAAFYPTLIDYERKVVGSIVDANGRIQPWRIGSEPWLALFH